MLNPKLQRTAFGTNVRSSFMIIATLSIFLLTTSVLGEGEANSSGVLNTVHEEEEAELHPDRAVLYPCFVLTLGVVVYYLLSRFLHWLPYTATMFLLGVIMGLLTKSEVVYAPEFSGGFMHDTILQWSSINSELLLLVFLPGLVFKDALSQNPYLFAIGFGQMFIFAFPLVLAGTYLTAVVGFYVFPYEWPFFLCLTFGSILSATDPVAVAALLEEVGAPPRLTTHIAGESLLNDGAAIVFFFIFKDLYFFESNVPLGEDINFLTGLQLFVQKAIGGCAIGFVAGGVIIVVMSVLNRRFGREENIVQVTAVLGNVYLNYFVADVVCRTSGVIATLAAGLCVKFFGRGAINDIHLMDDFFSVTEFILNTILFSLGGLVWGETLYEIHNNGFLTPIDWGYLVLLYILLHVIRAFLFVAVYPITARIGLKTNWKETAFQIYGGLRGAVGIALAIFLDNEVSKFVGDDEYDVRTEQEDVAQLYFMVGGVAFLTLFINGVTAGPFLKWLGLADAEPTRQKIIRAYQVQLRAEMIDSLVGLLQHERFKSIDFSFVRDNIPCLSDLTVDQLAEAVGRMKARTEPCKYSPPYLQNVLSVLESEDDLSSEEEGTPEILKESPEMHARTQRIEKRKRGKMMPRSSMFFMMKDDPLSTKELRLLFISVLKAQYEYLINEGLLTSEHGLTIALVQSLERAQTEVNRGGKLNDWHYLEEYYKLATKYSRLGDKVLSWFRCDHKHQKYWEEVDFRDFILEAFAFINAHNRAQEFFHDQLGNDDKDLSEAGKIVLAESKNQVEEVKKCLTSKYNGRIVSDVSTHKLCDILLNRSVFHIEKLVRFGLLKESEAEEIIGELTSLQNKVRRTKCKSAESGISDIREEVTEIEESPSLKKMNGDET